MKRIKRIIILIIMLMPTIIYAANININKNTQFSIFEYLYQKDFNISEATKIIFKNQLSQNPTYDKKVIIEENQIIAYQKDNIIIIESDGKLTLPSDARGFLSGFINATNDYVNIEYIEGLNNLDTKEVTDMSSFFFGLKKLKSLDISTFNTEKVENMSNMFLSLENITTLNLKNIKTTKNKNYQNMFSDMKKLTNLDISSFDTTNAITTESMFKNTNLSTINLSHFNTKNVENMESMFQENINLKSLNISNFDTKNVKTMKKMFYKCENLETINLKSFVTNNLLDISSMFEGMKKLKTLDITNFNTENVTKMDKTFYGLSSLQELDLRYTNTKSVISSIGVLDQTPAKLYYSEIYKLSKGDYTTEKIEKGAVLSVKFDDETDTISESQKEYQLKYKINAVSNPVYNLIITSSNNNIAKYEDGKIKILSSGTVTITLKADNKEDKITLNILSNDNKLKKLLINNKSYNVEEKIIDLEPTTEEILNIDATLNNTKSSITGTGKIKLTTGPNQIKIKITAEDSSINEYIINVEKIYVKSNDNKLKELKINGNEIKKIEDTIELDETLDTKIKIEALPNNENAIITGTGVFDLINGNNEFKIIVTAEDESIKEYIININKVEKLINYDKVCNTTIEELETKIKEINEDVIEIDINENTIINNNIFELLKNNNKILNLVKKENNIIIYRWQIDTRKITNNFSFNPNINEINDENINNIFKESKIVIKTEHNGLLPNKTKLKYNINNLFNENARLYLYLYKNNNLEVIDNNIIVKDNYIELTLDHLSEYILTTEKYEKQEIKEPNNTYIYISLVIILLIIITNIIIIIKLNNSIKVLKSKILKK